MSLKVIYIIYIIYTVHVNNTVVKLIFILFPVDRSIASSILIMTV